MNSLYVDESIEKDCKPTLNVLEKCLYLISILLREHSQRYKEKSQFEISKDIDPKKYLDARHVFDRFEFIKILNKISELNEAPENIQKFAGFLVKHYYNETGEIPAKNEDPKKTDQEKADEKSGEKTAKEIRREKARKARAKVLAKMKKQQKKVINNIDDFEENTGNKVETVVNHEEKLEQGMKRRSSTVDFSGKEISGNEFNPDIKRPKFTCSICRNDKDIDDMLEEGEETWVFVSSIQKAGSMKNFDHGLSSLSIAGVENNYIVQTCGHAFHSKCLKELEKNNSSSFMARGRKCPYCTTDYRPLNM